VQHGIEFRYLNGGVLEAVALYVKLRLVDGLP